MSFLPDAAAGTFTNPIPVKLPWDRPGYPQLRPPFAPTGPTSTSTDHVTRPPSASSSFLPLPLHQTHENGVGRESFAWPQPGIAQGQAETAGATEEGQNGWTLLKVQKLGRSRLHLFPCPWEGCDGLIASYALLKKHIKVHCDKTQERILRKHGHIPRNLFCGWEGCGVRETTGAVNAYKLYDHVDKVHLVREYRSYCPFKDCPSPHIVPHRYDSHFDVVPHPPPSPAVLRPSVQPRFKFKQIQPPPAPPPLPATCLISNLVVPDVLPHTPGVAPRMSRAYRSRDRLGLMAPPTPLARLQDPIVPIRDAADPFWPVCGDAVTSCINMPLATSSSIFRHPNYHRHQPPLSLVNERVRQALLAQTPAPSTDCEEAVTLSPPGCDTDTPSNAAPMVVRRKPDKARRPPLAAGAYCFSVNKRRIERDEAAAVRRRKGKGKGRARIKPDGNVDMDQGDEEEAPTTDNAVKISEERVRRAITRYASEKAGMSYGIDVLEETLRLERAGKLLGEL